MHLPLSTDYGRIYSSSSSSINFVKIGDNSGIIFLSTASGILSELGAILGSRILISQETSPTVIKTEIVLCEMGKVGKMVVFVI